MNPFRRNQMKALLLAVSFFASHRGLQGSERPVRSPHAVVDSVGEGSQAANAGVKVGDVVVALAGRRNPSLGEVLAHRSDLENAAQSALSLRRGKVFVFATLAQGDWGCSLGPDLSHAFGERLANLRHSSQAGAPSQDLRRAWGSLIADAERGGAREASLWLGLEWARTCRELGAWGESEEALRTVALRAPEGSFWRFQATLLRAEVLRSAGENARAVVAYAEASALGRASGSELRAASALTHWGVFEWRRGELSGARQLASEALAIRERIVPESLDVATSLNLEGNVAWGMGDLASAKGYHLRALAIRERLSPDGLLVAASLNNLGLVAQEQDDMDTALDFHRRSLAIKERLAPGSLDVAYSHNNLGIVAWKRGDLAGAWTHHHRALEIRERLAPESLQVAASLDNLSYLATDRGDLAAARRYGLRALAIQERLAPGSPDVAWSLLSLGNASRNQGDLDEAKEYYLRVLAIRERLAPDSSDIAWTLVGLGNVAFDSGDLNSARDFYGRALAQRQRLAPDGLGVAACLTNLGTVALQQGDLAAARDRFSKSLTLCAALAPDGLDVAANLAHLGDTALAGGDADAARESYAESLRIRERLAPGSYAVAETLWSLARVEREAGDLLLGAELMLRAVEAFEAQRGKIGGDHAKTSFSAAHGAVYSDLLATYLALGKPELALATLERSRAKALLEMVSSRFVDLRGEVPDDLLGRRLGLALQRKSLEDKLSMADAKTDPAHVEAWRSELLMLPQKEDALAEEIREASPRLANLEYPKPLDFEGIVGALEPGTLLVAYAVSEKDTLLFTLLSPSRSEAPPAEKSRRGASPPSPPVDRLVGHLGDFAVTTPGGFLLRAVKLPFGRRDLGTRIRFFRALMCPETPGGPTPGAWRNLAGRLFQILLGPVTADLAACDRILLLPDGPLHLLPFAALVPSGKRMPKGLKPEPLGLQRPISVEASVTVFRELEARRATGAEPREASHGSARPPSWTGFGDPLYPQSTGGEESWSGAPRFALEALSGTRQEIETIAGLFGANAACHLGRDATEEAVRSLPHKESPYIHFACHGLVDPRFPLNSALALTPTEPDQEGDSSFGDTRRDGLLQAWEIIQDVRLESECVVLSACETGTGKVLGGEGILGLTRAFYYAGAKSIVVSLWPISDESTASLMGSYYRELLGGSPRDAALQRAQARLSADARHSHPFYWAAFQLHGRHD